MLAIAQQLKTYAALRPTDRRYLILFDALAPKEDLLLFR